jgi:hypothetical protein
VNLLGERNSKYLALHIFAIFAAFSLDEFSTSIGIFVCDQLRNIDADYIISQLNSCLMPVEVGYFLILLLVMVVFGGGFFFVWGD